MRKITSNRLIVALICAVNLLFVFTEPVKSQTRIEGQVIDKVTQLAIPSVTVQMVREKLTTSTNGQGYFKFDLEQMISNDTLVFSSIGYLTYKLPTSNYVPNGFIQLQPSNTSLKQVDITSTELKTKRINGFDLGHVISDFESAPTPYTSQFAYAKLFTVPTENALLTKIEIGRIGFESKRRTRVSADGSFPELPLIKTNPKTRFLIHVMTVNPRSNLPDVTLFTKVISLDDNLIWVTIDLAKEGVVLAAKEFFLAVEWLRIPYNEIIKLEWAPRIRGLRKNGEQLLEDVSQYRVLYQPAMASYKSEKKVPSYIKTKRGTWVPAHNSGEVALSASVKY